MLWLLGSHVSPAQSQRAANPFEGNSDAARRGALLYRARCAGCHGLDGRGVSGPDLTALLAAGLSDARFFTTARNGVAGTEMPRLIPEQTTDTQIWEILTHLRTLTSGVPEAVQGNADNGARLFQANCLGCHIVNGKGGRLGPNLSRIGVGAFTLGAHREDPQPEPKLCDRVSARHAGDLRWSPRPRSQEERRCVHDPDHGDDGAHTGVPEKGSP